MVTIDKNHNLPIFIVCDFCKNVIEKKRTCRAFPKGIPNVILEGKDEHNTLINGQNGLYLYKPINEKIK